MKRYLVLLLIVLAVSVGYALVDLNKASLADIKQLPITEKQAQDIYDYRLYQAYFESIYDLRSIPSIDQKTMLQLRDLVTVSHYIETDETIQRRREIGYLLEQLGSSEGTQEGFADVWEDYLMTPQDLNTMFFSDLLNLPNVSPIDAASVMLRKAAGDTIADYRDLRNTQGLSHYGATNIKNYVYYKEAKGAQKVYANYQFKLETKPYEDDVSAMYHELIKEKNDNGKDRSYSNWGYYKMGNSSASTMNKLRIRYANNLKFGLLSFNQIGEKNILNANSTELARDAKVYAGAETNFDFMGYNSLKVYLGNYRATYGEGLVVENTDYYNSRKTGFGFSKRILGITGDLSRTQEFALKGLALEWKNTWWNMGLFYSRDKKDAVVYNTDGDSTITSGDKDSQGNYKVLSYITPTRRFTDDELSQSDLYFNSNLVTPMKLYVRKDVLDETVMGGHLEFTPYVGTHIGMTGLQTIYNNADFVMPKHGLDSLFIRDAADYDKWKINDNETSAMYSTETSKYSRDYRTVLGFDWQTVFNNTSFQGEYAELSVDGKDGKIGDDPKALVTSAYTQFDNFYILSLYRDYDLDFDNPYSRSYSEHQKFDDTIFDKNAYALTNPLLADIFLNGAQAQAEKGIYFETRYRFNNYFTLNRTYLDMWERKSDARRSVRFQGDLDYRPIYQLSLRLKYKNQINRYDDLADRGVSKTSETAGIVRTYLSNRDKIEIEYRYTQVWQPPYTYLTNDPESGTDNIAEGTMLMHGDLVIAKFDHNFSEDLETQHAFAVWNGHDVSHWDWEDMEIDFMGESGIKYWFLIEDKIANNLYLSLKCKYKHYLARDYTMRSWANGEVTSGVAYYPRVEHNETAVRLQLDWKF